MRYGSFACVSLFACACAPAAAATTPLHVARWVGRNLDRDANPERVELLAGSVINHYGGSRPIPARLVRITDGRRHSAISPRLENIPGFRVGDFTGDGVADVFWTGWNGNAGAVPVQAAVVDWTGTRPRYLWKYSAAYSTLGNRYDGARVRLFNDPTADSPGTEIELDEGDASPGDPSRCPSRILKTFFRVGALGTYVQYRRLDIKV